MGLLNLVIPSVFSHTGRTHNNFLRKWEIDRAAGPEFCLLNSMEGEGGSLHIKVGLLLFDDNERKIGGKFEK